MSNEICENYSKLNIICYIYIYISMEWHIIILKYLPEYENSQAEK